MSKVCFIHTDTTGLHPSHNENITKKNLFEFSRMVTFSWIIASKLENGKYNIDKREYFIIKPRCMYIHPNTVQYHGITQEIALKKGHDIEDVLEKFIKDIYDIKYIISHSLEFHMKTVQGELVRYNKNMNFRKHILIDINSFEHKIQPSTLKNIYQVTFNKKILDKTQIIDSVCELFFKLYDDYSKKIISE